MRRFIPLGLVMLLLCVGCGPSSSITAVTRKPPILPFTKILVVYAEDPCDFTLFDSVSYNICLRSCFLNSDDFDGRVHAENMLSNELTRAAAIVRSTDVLDAYNNSYDYFRRTIDSLRIEAMLLVNLRRYTHSTFPSPPTVPNQQYTTLNADFACYLMDTRNISMPVWTAGLGTKGDLYSGPRSLKRKMITTLVKELKKEGYFLH